MYIDFSKLTSNCIAEKASIAARLEARRKQRHGRVLSELKRRCAFQTIAIENLYRVLRCMADQQHLDALEAFSAAEAARSQAASIAIESLSELRAQLIAHSGL